MFKQIVLGFHLPTDCINERVKFKKNGQNAF